MQMRTWQSLTVSVLLASAVACGNRDNDSERADGVSSTDRGGTNTTGTSNTSGTYGASGSTATDTQSAQNPATVAGASTSSTLTGCLQRSGSRDFILTLIDQPSTSVGTAGNGPAGGGARDEMRAAARSYKLESNDDRQFDSLIGHQVRVVGTTSEPASPAPTVGSAETANRSDATQSPPRQDQFAQFKVTSISEVAASCSQSAATGTSGANGAPSQFGTRGSSSGSDANGAGGQFDRSNSPRDR